MSSSEVGYRDYIHDDRHMTAYQRYQARYATTVRESDRRLIERVARETGRLREEGREPVRVLDIGCSTGNLLRHLRHTVGGVELVGGDIVESVVAACREDPDLEGVRFEVMDMLNLEPAGGYDVVIANAALMFFTDAEFGAALASIGRALAPGGAMLAFDYFHPYQQEVAITERSAEHPEGLRFHFRSQARASEWLARAKLTDAVFTPFSIPIDLAISEDPASINTHTVRTEAGERLCFRGTLFQPWSFLEARRSLD